MRGAVAKRAVPVNSAKKSEWKKRRSVFFQPPLIRQILQHLDTQYHNQQPNRHDDQQRKSKPAEHHRRGPDAAFDAPVRHVLRDDTRRHRRRVLPQHRHQHEDRRDEDDGQRDLRHGPRGEGLDVDVGPVFVLVAVPPREGREEDEAYEGEDDGDNSEILSVLLFHGEAGYLH